MPLLFTHLSRRELETVSRCIVRVVFSKFQCLAGFAKRSQITRAQQPDKRRWTKVVKGGRGWEALRTIGSPLIKYTGLMFPFLQCNLCSTCSPTQVKSCDLLWISKVKKDRNNCQSCAYNKTQFAITLPRPAWNTPKLWLIGILARSSPSPQWRPEENITSEGWSGNSQFMTLNCKIALELKPRVQNCMIMPLGGEEMVPLLIVLCSLLPRNPWNSCHKLLSHFLNFYNLCIPYFTTLLRVVRWHFITFSKN